MKKIYFLFIALLISTVSIGQVINEIDADQTGTDMGEFIELKWTPNTSLNGLAVVLFNGSDDLSYIAWDLDGFTTDANGFFILANTPLAQAGDLDIGASNMVQNGADAVALYMDDAVNWPNDTAISLTGLIDVVVYGTSDPDDAGLLGGFGETTQYDENLNGLKDTESLQRTDDGLSYETKTPTFRAENSSPTCDLSLTTTDAVCDAFTNGVDTYTATVDFVGGGTSTYSVTSDFGTVDLSAGDPDVDATGTITVTGVNEGTDVTVTVTDSGVCNLMSTVTSPTCVPSAVLPLFDDFTYADGSLVPNGGWANHSGTAGDMLVSAGQVVVQHGTPSEDVNLPFTPVAGNVYYGFDFSVDDLGAPYSNLGTDYEYFAHFKDAAFNFSARMDIVPPSAAGDYSVGISSDASTADAVWGTDLTFGTTYRVIVRYNQDMNQAELWIDANVEADPSILGLDQPDPGDVVASFALRQSDSDENETIRVDNLSIASTFDGVTLSTNSFSLDTFKMYPNPNNTGVLNIDSINNDGLKAQVFDLLGKEVIQNTHVHGTLDVSELSSGLYIVKLTQGNASVTKKLVIQ